MIERISVRSRGRDDWIDITGKVRDIVARSGIEEGVVTVYVPHTTAGVTIQENADPPLRDDITTALEGLFPRLGDYRHCEDNAASHMKAVLTGPSVQIPFAHGRLVLGTWQAIYFCDFDGPRSREVVVHVP